MKYTMSIKESKWKSERERERLFHGAHQAFSMFFYTILNIKKQKSKYLTILKKRKKKVISLSERSNALYIASHNFPEFILYIHSILIDF